MDLRSFSQTAGHWVRQSLLSLTDRQRWIGWLRGGAGWTLLCLLLLGVVAVPVIFSRLGEPALRNDEAIYARIADHMHDKGEWLVCHLGRFPYFMKPPLYSWLTTLTYDLFSDGLRYRFWSALFGLGCVLLTCVAGTRLWGSRVGLLAGGILLLNGDFLFNHGIREGCMDTGVTFFTLACLLCYWSAVQSKRPVWWWLGLGLCAGCASMLKSLTGLPLVALFGLHHLLVQQNSPQLRKWLRIGLAVAASLVLIAPWAVYQWWYFRDVFVQNFFWDSLVKRYNGGLDPTHLHGMFFYLFNITESSKPFLLFLPALLFCGLGSFYGSRRLACSLTAVLIAGWVALFSLGASKLCWYVYPVYPLIAVAVAALVLTGLEQLSTRLAPRRWGAVVLGVAYVAVLLPVLGKDYQHFQHVRTSPVEQYAPWQAYSRFQSAIENKEVLFVLYKLPGLQDENYHWYYAGKMKRALHIWQSEQLQRILAREQPTLLVLRPHDLPEVNRECEVLACDNPECFLPTRDNYCVVAVGGHGRLLEGCFKTLPASCPIKHLESGQEAQNLW
jgi:hypothetical protein